MESPSGNVLRLYIPPKGGDDRVEELIKICKRVNCREVILFTSSYDRQPSFIPIDDYAHYSKLLNKWKERFDEAGIKAGLNVMQTTGHIYYPSELSRKFNFQRKISDEGKEDGGGACPLCPNLRKHVEEEYRVLASAKPHLIFVDDDFRYYIRGYFCFCPLHMERLSKELGRPIIREEAVRIMLDGDHDEHYVMRKAFRKVGTDAIVEMAQIIRRVVDEEEPECIVGLMTATVPAGSWGMDYEKVTKALANSKALPAIRPQISGYTEHNLKAIQSAVHQPAILREMLSGNTLFYPEIENYPYTSWSKSPDFTRVQMTLAHLDGFNKLALNLFDFLGNPLEENEDIVAMLEQYKEYFNQLQSSIPEGTKSIGIGIPMFPEVLERHRVTSGNKNMSGLIQSNMAYYHIPLLGLPLGFNWLNNDFLLLAGDSVDVLSDDEIDSILSRGVVMDVRAARILIERGFGNRIGVELGEGVTQDDSGIETFKAFCGGYSGHSRPVRYCVTADNWCHKLIVNDDIENTVLSVLENYKGEEITPTAVLTKNNRGEKFGIFAFSLNDVNDFMMCHSYRRAQMIEMFELVTGKKLPVVVLDVAYVAPVYVPINEDTVILGLSNHAEGTQKRIRIALDRGMPKQVEILQPDGEWTMCNSFIPNDENSISIKDEMTPCSILVYRLNY